MLHEFYYPFAKLVEEKKTELKRSDFIYVEKSSPMRSLESHRRRPSDLAALGWTLSPQDPQQGNRRWTW